MSHDRVCFCGREQFEFDPCKRGDCPKKPKEEKTMTDENPKQEQETEVSEDKPVPLVDIHVYTNVVYDSGMDNFPAVVSSDLCYPLQGLSVVRLEGVLATEMRKVIEEIDSRGLFCVNEKDNELIIFPAHSVLYVNVSKTPGEAL
jgi:hypothetical protein